MNPENQPTQNQGNFGFAILGFCIPIVGLVLFLVWNKERPADAKYAGMGALINVILGVVLFIFMVILGAFAGAAY
ncbi:MAG: hypothetical protein ACNA7U_05280 [Candidatus Izemoplasmataceae bacterium]|jgi:hypothetical protein|uniref:hypothetical protein n=1 Tax=Liberiplasma polymorphum TaxID=3374570 RepID=UPI0037744522